MSDEIKWSRYKCEGKRCGYIFEWNSEVAGKLIHCPVCGGWGKYFEGDLPQRPSILKHIFTMLAVNFICFIIGWKLGVFWYSMLPK